jgi:hypothetical protein
MTLPIILEVAISLTFVYLILSLLVSGFQEIIAILLQSRATRLWVSLINLISTDDERSRALNDKARETSTTRLINTLYQNVLVQNLNQDAKRWFHHIPIPFINKTSSAIFRVGSASGPSYLPAETFATALLKTLGIAELSKSLSDARLKAFFEEQLERIEDLLPDVSAPGKHEQFDGLKQDVARLTTDYAEEKISLAASVKSILDKLLLYLSTPEGEKSPDYPDDWYALEAYFKGLANNESDDFTLLVRKFTANPLEIIQALKKITDRTSREISQVSNTVDAVREFKQLVKGLIYLLKEKQHNLALSAIPEISTADLGIAAYILYESLEKEIISELIQTYRALQIPEIQPAVETLSKQMQHEQVFNDELNQTTTELLDVIKGYLRAVGSGKAQVWTLFQNIEVLRRVASTLRSSRDALKFQRQNYYAQRADSLAELIGILNTQIAKKSDGDEKNLLINLVSILRQNESIMALQFVQTADTFRRMRSHSEFESINTQFQALINLYDTEELLYGEIGQAIHRLGKTVYDYKRLLPRSLVESLDALIDRVRINSKNTEIEIRSLQQEIEAWFDRAMDRATGVYKRNSKGAAFLLGMMIAFAINADTFHLFGQLSKDTNLRTIVTQRAIQSSEQLNAAPAAATAATASTSDNLNAVLEEANKAFEGIPLPVGWNYDNVKEQLCPNPVAAGQSFASIPNRLTGDSGATLQATPKAVKPNGKSGDVVWFWETPFGASGCAGVNRNWGESIWVRLKMLVGWFLTAGAIAMGAPFWFELMSQLINIRGTGKPPKSSS